MCQKKSVDFDLCDNGKTRSCREKNRNGKCYEIVAHKIVVTVGTRKCQAKKSRGFCPVYAGFSGLPVSARCAVFLFFFSASRTATFHKVVLLFKCM